MTSPKIVPVPSDTQVLDLTHQHLTELPDDFAKLTHLKVVLLSYNDFTEVPSVLGMMESLEFIGMKSCNISSIPADSVPKNLRWLTLTDNKLVELPSSIGRLDNLEKLLLSGNRIHSLPNELKNCQKLKLIRLAANDFHESPLSFFNDFGALSWYGDAGNSFSFHEHINTPYLPWDKIVLKERIGESAQNSTFRGILHSGEEVAIKIFGKNINSDGYAADDIHAAATAGDHAHVIGVIGTTTTPEQKTALILPLIPKEFQKLGQPPSFDSCWSDVYPSETTFSLEVILKLLESIASACVHLHDNGIMHGDLYAHNILANQLGYGYLGDFGSASTYVPGTDPLRQQIDVCAFGHLINDLLTHCPESSSVLTNLRQSCLNPVPSQRPTFREIEDLLPR